MNSLMNYGSDDDYEDSADEKIMDSQPGNSRNCRKMGGSGGQVDANYDEVQMDLSEDSNDSKTGKDSCRASKERDRVDNRKRYERENRNSPKSRDDYRHRDRKEESDRYTTTARGDRDRDEDKPKYREERNDDRTRERSDRYRDERDEDKPRDRTDKYRDEEDKSRDRHRDDRYSRDRRDRKRSRSRERRRSRSPRRERSKSRDRSGGRGYNKRYDRANNKMDRLDKMGIEIKTPDCQYVKPSDLQKSMNDEKNDGKDRFFMPGITGRFRDQIERRKLLWQKKEPEVAKAEIIPQPAPGGSRTTKVWEATTFAQDTDGKVASKFKRLMGIKNAADGANSATDGLKKQEEMFSSMEQQYEVARTATHTMRGVGLGFGSYQR